MNKATFFFVLLLMGASIIPITYSQSQIYASIPSSGTITYERTRFGINVHGQDIDRWDLSEPALTLADFQRIRSWGLDTVQFFLQWNKIEPTIGVYDEGFLQKVDIVIDRATQAGLNFVIKIHINYLNPENGGWQNYENLWTDDVVQERFYALWEMLVLRYKDYQNAYAWSLLNEPIPDSTIGPWTEEEKQVVFDNWNRGGISDACIERIRAIDSRPIMLTYGIWGSPVHYANFGPRPYENIIYVFSWYLPVAVSHWGSEWTGDKQKLLDVGLQAAIDFKNTYNVKMLAQEIGLRVIPYGYSESRLRWIDESLQILNDENIGWYYYIYSHWDNFTMNVLDENNNELPTVDIIKANIP